MSSPTSSEYPDAVGSVAAAEAVYGYIEQGIRKTLRKGWHRATFHFQFKAMIYLSDVRMDNGPFEILHGAHRTLQVTRDTFVARLPSPKVLTLAPVRNGEFAAQVPR